MHLSPVWRRISLWRSSWVGFWEVLISVAIGIALAPHTMVIHAAESPQMPHGIFSLTTAGKPVPSAILTNPHVTGVAIRGKWQDVERSEGIYDWSYFDTEIARVKQAGKKVLLRITTGGYNTPQWVFNAGVQTFTFVDKNPMSQTYNKTLTIPLFWDKVFLQKKKKFLLAMGQHFSLESAILLVSTSCANATTDDWNVPGSQVDVTNWKAAGYSSDKLINSCIEIIDTSMKAFPSQFNFLAVSTNSKNLDPNPNYVANQVVDYAMTKYVGRFIVQKNSLSANIPNPLMLPTLGAWQIIFDNQPMTAGQMLWFVTS
jgi:hypothetical protein